jgi:hypothetical protein
MVAVPSSPLTMFCTSLFSYDKSSRLPGWAFSGKPRFVNVCAEGSLGRFTGAVVSGGFALLRMVSFYARAVDVDSSCA